MNNIVDLKTHLPTLKESLENSLKDPFVCLTKVYPSDFEVKKQAYRQAIHNKQKDLTGFEDLLIFLVEGYVERPDGQSIYKHLVQLFGGEEPKWAKSVKRIADRKSYSPYDDDQTIQKQPRPFVYEIKSKYLPSLQAYYTEEALDNCRKMRSQKLKSNKKLLQLIRSIQKDRNDAQTLDLFMKILKDMNKNSTEAKKSKKIDKQTQVIPEPEKEKESIEPASTDNNTPTKKQMEIEQPKDNSQKKQKKKGPKQKKQPESDKLQNKMEVENPQEEVVQQVATPTVIPPPQPTKPNNQKKLSEFFSKKNPTQSTNNPVKQDVMAMQVEPQPSEFEKVIQNLRHPHKNLNQLCQQFKRPSKIEESQPTQLKPHSVFLSIYDSGFFMSGYDISREIDATKPKDQHSQINYEDSYQQYDEYIELLKEENIEKEEEKSVDDEQNSNEGTIVDDGYLSKSELSSESEAEGMTRGKNGDIEVEGEIISWEWTNEGNTPKEGHMIVILDDLEMPIQLKTEKEKITMAQKLEFIKVAHGSFQSADDIVNKLKENMPQMSKYQIKLNLTEMTFKQKKCPRLAKGYFLSEMEQAILNEGIDLLALVQMRKKEREEEKTKRREDRKKEKAEKNTLHNYSNKHQDKETLQNPPQETIPQSNPSNPNV